MIVSIHRDDYEALKALVEACEKDFAGDEMTPELYPDQEDIFPSVLPYFRSYSQSAISH